MKPALQFPLSRSETNWDGLRVRLSLAWPHYVADVTNFLDNLPEWTLEGMSCSTKIQVVLSPRFNRRDAAGLVPEYAVLPIREQFLALAHVLKLNLHEKRTESQVSFEIGAWDKNRFIARPRKKPCRHRK